MSFKFEIDFRNPVGREMQGFPVLDTQTHLKRIVREAVEDMAQFMESKSADLAPKRSTDLASSIKVTRASRDLITDFEATVSVDASYARYVSEGTGIYYGTHGNIIKSKTGKMFRIPLKDLTGGGVHDKNVRKFVSRGYLYIESVKGQKANNFIEEAYQITDKEYVPLRLEKLRVEWAAFRAGSGK